MNTSRSLSVVKDDPAPTAGEGVSAPTRELAQRLSGTVEVRLLWQPETDRVHLSVRDFATGTGFDIAIARGNAIDAFYHPYAYAARRENSYQVGRAETAILDG